MTTWQPIKTAPKDGSSILLWARRAAFPPEPNSYAPVVGYWHGAPGVERWKSRDTEEDLIADKWAPIPSTEDDQ